MVDSFAALDTTWLRTPAPRPAAGTNLVVLPHAGGAANYYRDWAAALPADVETHVVQYPGRENRFGEPFVRSMAELADAVASVVAPLFDRPTVLFGHSMGASLMYEVGLRCETAGRRPALLIASGHAAPHRHERKELYRAPDEELVAEVRKLSDDGAPVLDDPELREMFLPLIRADYEVIETYDPGQRPAPVDAPLAVFRGAEDDDVDEHKADAWTELTATGALRTHRVFDGGHFYLRRHRAAVLAAIADEIGSLSPAH